jgi:hypothetical protein
LPAAIRQSEYLANNNLSRLANLEKLPTADEIAAIRQEPYVQYLLMKYASNPEQQKAELEKLAKKFILLNQPEKALQILLFLLEK